MASAEKLSKLRALFVSPRVAAVTGGQPLAAYLLPSTDAHQSEYLADFDFRVKFLSGFTGTNAFVLVTKSKALLWTDGRYFTQAAKQLDSNWDLMKQAIPDSILPNDWLVANLSPKSHIGFDPQLQTYEQGEKLMKELSNMDLIPVPIIGNLIDEFWADRPQLPNTPLLVLKADEHGKVVSEKVKELREKIGKKKCSAIVLGALDDIMWLLNVRGSDIKCNPLAYSYLFLTMDAIHFFIDERKLNVENREHLSQSGVTIHKYTETFDWLSSWWAQNRGSVGQRKWWELVSYIHTESVTDDPNIGVRLSERSPFGVHSFKGLAENELAKVFVPVSTNHMIGSIFKDSLYTDVSPVFIAKAVKNAVEMVGMRNSHIRDGAALVEFLAWLEKEVLDGKQCTEIEAANKYFCFSTISAAGDHAALPHYRPLGEEGKRLVTKDQVYLVDSGGQYRDGTTDVTRTIWLGDVSKIPQEFITHNTLVLQGHINLAMTKFPNAILGVRLDTLTRHAMWQQGLDFGHGTGHGVGHFLNVHEGPAGIAFRVQPAGGEIQKHMVLTIEPGLYIPGKWGIRIENCYETVSAKMASDAEFLGFESLTLAPIQTSIINASLLTPAQVTWLNSYHDRVLKVVGGFLKEKGKNRVYQWLEKQCQHI